MLACLSRMHPLCGQLSVVAALLWLHSRQEVPGQWGSECPGGAQQEAAACSPQSRQSEGVLDQGAELLHQDLPPLSTTRGQ